MIPAKGMKIGIWQYMPQKIQKWGFNNFLRAGKSGVIYDFIYEGAGTTGREKCGAKDVGFCYSKTSQRIQTLKHSLITAFPPFHFFLNQRVGGF